MTVTAKYQDQVRFLVEARGHKIICDQPAENKGTDQGFTPPELFNASLATCAAYYAVEYLKTRNLPTQPVEVKVHAEKAAAPARLGKFLIEVETPQLDERHQQGVLRAVKNCLIHNTLLHSPEVAVELTTPVAA